MDAATGSVPQASSMGIHAGVETDNPQHSGEAGRPSIGDRLLRGAHELLERLTSSREFNLYIDSESVFGQQVHGWLDRYARARLGRGFALASTQASTALGELEAAADELVEQLIVRGDTGSICTVCHRATLNGVLGHADGCAIAKLYGAVAGVREAAAPVESDESWEASEALLRKGPASAGVATEGVAR